MGVEYPRLKCGKPWSLHECPQVIRRYLQYLNDSCLYFPADIARAIPAPKCFFLTKTSYHPRLQKCSEFLQNFLRSQAQWAKLSTLDPARRLGGSEAQARVWNLRWRSSPHALGYLANFISSGTVGTWKSRRLQVPNKSNMLWQDPFLFQKGNICDMFDKLIRFTTGAALDPTVQSHWMIEAQTRPESIATLVNPSHYSECFEDKRLCTVIKLSEKIMDVTWCH